MADRKPGRLVHHVEADLKTSVPLVRSGIEFHVFRKWKKRADQRRGSLLVNAAGIRWRFSKARRSRRISWGELEDWIEST